MAHTGVMQEEDFNAKQGSSVCLRSRPCSSERDSQVRVVKAALQSRLGPYEPVLTYLQSVLVWERPLQCVLLYILVNVVFWWVWAHCFVHFDGELVLEQHTFRQLNSVKQYDCYTLKRKPAWLQAAGACAQCKCFTCHLKTIKMAEWWYYI